MDPTNPPDFAYRMEHQNQHKPKILLILYDLKKKGEVLKNNRQSIGSYFADLQQW